MTIVISMDNGRIKELVEWLDEIEALVDGEIWYGKDRAAKTDILSLLAEKRESNGKQGD